MYFEWKTYLFSPPPELRGGKSDCQVAVIGAGPVGLSAALGLARRGVRVVLLEARDGVSDGSRAISLDRQSMRMLDRLGAGAAFAARCIPRVENVVYYRDQPVYSMAYTRPEGEKHFELNILQQCWMEQILLDTLMASPGADVRWHSQVERIVDKGDAVELGVKTPEGPYKLRADYVIAADGGRGRTRSLLGLDYERQTTENISERPFIICDFEMQTNLSKARRLFLNPPYKPGSTLLLHAQPFDTWRLDYPVGDDEDPDEAAKPHKVEERLNAHLTWMGENGPRKLLWTSVYRPRAASLAGYRKGRIFFAGDSAHLSPIFGGRGLNMGFADSFNLAWKLGMVLNGAARDQLLDTYDFERRQIVKKTLSDLSQAAVFMARPTRGVTLMSDAVLDLIPEVPFVRDLFDAHRAPKREGYSQTADWTDDPPRGPYPGNPLPNPPLKTKNGQEAYLYDLLPHDLVGIYLSPKGGIPPEDLATLTRIEKRAPFRRFVITNAAGEGVDGIDSEGAVGRAFSAENGVLLLVRPDAYIAARFETGKLDALDKAIQEFMGKSAQSEAGARR